MPKSVQHNNSAKSKSSNKKTITAIRKRIDAERRKKGKPPFSEKTWEAITYVLLNLKRSPENDRKALLKITSILKREL